MNKKTMSQLALGLMAALSFNAIAQESPWMVRVRATNLNWDNKNDAQLVEAVGAEVTAKNKTIPEVDITYFFSKNIAAELVLSYPQRVEVRAGSDSLGTVTALPPTFLAQYHFTQFGPLKPYVGAGINYTVFSQRDNMTYSGTPSVESSSVGFAAQVGMDYMYTKNWGVNFDVKYIQIKTDVNHSTLGNLGELKLNPLVTSAGVTYKF